MIYTRMQRLRCSTPVLETKFHPLFACCGAPFSSTLYRWDSEMFRKICHSHLSLQRLHVLLLIAGDIISSNLGEKNAGDTANIGYAVVERRKFPECEWGSIRCPRLVNILYRQNQTAMIITASVPLSELPIVSSLPFPDQHEHARIRRIEPICPISRITSEG